MIANKHTEVRLMSNLNDLLEDSKAKQDINKKIHRHTHEYIMTYVSDNDLEDKTIYDKLEEISDSYQKHCYNIAKEIKDEILEENGEEIEVYETIRGVQVVKKDIYLNPKKFSQTFKNDLEEDLSKMVIDNFFKELDNVIKVFEYKKKLDNLRKKDNKLILKERQDEIIKIIRDTIEEDYEICLEEHNDNHILILDNFENVRDVRDTLLDDIIKNIYNSLEERFDKADIESMFKKEVSLFIKEQKALLGLNKSKSKDTLGQIIQHPKLARMYMISQMWKDITK